MVNVATMLSRTARLHPDRPALRYGERRMTYAELDGAVARFASGLRTTGLEPGDRVAVFAKNCPECVIAMYGAFAAGMTIVPVNAKLAAPELAVILEDSGARALVHDHASAALVDAAGTPGLDLVLETGAAFDAFLAGGDAGQAPAEVTDDAVAWLFYTSGTTGRPKGAELTHRNLTAMTWLELADVCDFHADDVVLHVAPLSHGGGLYLLGAIARGAENLIYDRSSFDAVDVMRLIEREAVTVIAFLAPTMIVMLLDADDEAGADTSSLRRAVYGGAPIHLEHARRMVQRFGPAFVQIYGQGESPMTITYLDTAAPGTDEPDLLIAAGVAHAGVEVAVLDADDRPLPVGAEGEVCVRGDTVMRGYRNNPEATAAALRGGWLHTGDIGRFDDRGRLFLLDRSKDTIISGGTNIYPREVEEVLVQHDAVDEVVVFGEPDELWGESVVAAVVSPAGDRPSEDELIALCRSRLASFKKPKRIVFVDALPKNAYGKILRREVRDQLTGGEGAGT
ncbi:MAG TPA: long-chain fatty acid--CoA ligase [Baekduia sp.]|nr:long-chain fatty acid--CoA ligase [Baekduia sp.]